MKISILILIIFVFTLHLGCTSDDYESLEVQPIPQSENLNLDFNKWIYSQMNHDYLWREDMPDSLECNYDLEPTKFYASLLSSKDRFSYSEKNESYSPVVTNKNVGYEYQTYTLDCGIEVRQVLYITNLELRQKGLKRGDFALAKDDNKQIIRININDTEVVPIDTLEITNPFGPTQTVYLDSIYNIDNRKVGYLCYLEFDEVEDLVPALKRFYDVHVDDLILDLRYNPGGYVSTCKYLANSIINESGYNKIFQQCTYNDILTKEYEKATGSGITINSFGTPNNGKNTLGSPMYGLNLKRVYVLTSKYSASASEAAIICVRPFMDVVLIGEQTYGKGVGSWTIRDNRFKYQLQPITMRYHNALMETTPDDGIPVNYYVPDGYDTRKIDLGELQEPLLAKAIELIGGQSKQDDDKKSGDMANTRSSYQELHLKEVGVPSFFNIHENK